MGLRHLDKTHDVYVRHTTWRYQDVCLRSLSFIGRVTLLQKSPISDSFAKEPYKREAPETYILEPPKESLSQKSHSETYVVTHDTCQTYDLVVPKCVSFV